jgi:ABC-2 type transport system ATP-binding protein
MDDTAIKVEHVSKTFKLPHERQSSIKSALINFGKSKRGYEKQQVLEGVSFEIKKGEFFGIVGRNGSGKSTLLKLLAGIYTPSTGSVQINGKLTPFIELGVGFNPELTGRENVFLNGALLGFNRKEMEAMYDDIVAFAELDRFMDQKLKNYSSGMQVRLAFSVAIRAETDILLIDEVLAVGDQSFQEKCYGYFSTIKNSGKTVVFVTHDMASVERFCDRAYVLDKKKDINGLYDIPSAVALYNQLNHEKTLSSSDLKNRKKNGIFVKDVAIYGSDKKKRSTFDQGETLHVRIDIGSTFEKPENITVGLAFHDKDNVNLAGPNSQGQIVKSDVGSVEYVIHKLPFNMGEYFMTVAILDSKSAKQFDLIDHGVAFFVNTPKVHYGKVVLDDHWNIK